MVCIVHPLPAVSLESPRDWSHKWDGHEPPHRGEHCYCLMLCGIRKKADWQPDTLDAMPPLAVLRGGVLDWWSRHLDIVQRDSIDFNGRQVKGRLKGKRITLWAVPCFGNCEFSETAQPITKGGGA